MKEFDFEKGSYVAEFISKVIGAITAFIIMVFTGKTFTNYLKRQKETTE